MKVILIGYPGSQCIVPASKYLTNKYLPGFDITYINYKGEIHQWASYVAAYLSALPDKFIIFALDDYLLAGSHLDTINRLGYTDNGISDDENLVCVKLCKCTPQENEEYPITTQYCIWNREYLISLLRQVNNPWQFEIQGSEMFKTSGKRFLYLPCLEYFTNSSISSRWEGIRLDGLKEEDIKYIKANGLIS